MNQNNQDRKNSGLDGGAEYRIHERKKKVQEDIKKLQNPRTKLLLPITHLCELNTCSMWWKPGTGNVGGNGVISPMTWLQISDKMLDKASKNPGKYTSLIVLCWIRSTSRIEVKTDPNGNVLTQQLLRVQRSSGP